MAHSVSLRGITKRFGQQVVLNAIHLEVVAGEFLTLLGPSGCGKTTLLRAVAGLYQPDEGSIHVNDRDITTQPTHQRDMGMVFQSYAVFPHLSVADNVAYGLQARRCSGAEIQSRVRQALQKVKLDHLSERFPSELSGGQKQRVGLARAMVIEPTLLLMDEPLSNLDAKLRVDMRQEIRLLQRDLGITTLYVTHDQEEALAVSDRIAVMNAGNVVQLGTPENIYGDPQHVFVMDFVGGCNWVEGHVEVSQSGPVLKTDQGTRLDVSGVVSVAACRECEGQAVILGIRFDALGFGTPDRFNGWTDASVLVKTYFGSHVQYHVRTDDGTDLVFNSPGTAPVHLEGQRAAIRLSSSGIYLFDAKSGQRLT